MRFESSNGAKLKTNRKMELIKLESIDLAYFVEQFKGDNVDELYQFILDEGGFNVEVIYYKSAMEYLMREDDSLTESLEIADELGYNLNSLDSEVLASLLASRRAEEEFQENKSEIQDYLDCRSQK